MAPRSQSRIQLVSVFLALADLAVLTVSEGQRLAGINQVGIADLLPVRLVNDGVSRASAVGVAAETPEAIAAGDRGSRDLRHNHGEGEPPSGRTVDDGGRQLRLLCSGNVRPLGRRGLRRQRRGGQSVGNVERYLGARAHRTGTRPQLVQPDAVAAGHDPFIDRERKTSIRAGRYRTNKAIVEIKPHRRAGTRLRPLTWSLLPGSVSTASTTTAPPAALALLAAIARRWVCLASSAPRTAGRPTRLKRHRYALFGRGLFAVRLLGAQRQIVGAWREAEAGP